MGNHCARLGGLGTTEGPIQVNTLHVAQIRCFYLMLESCPPESVPLLVNNLKAVPDGLRFEEIWNFGLLQIDNLKTHLVD